MEEEDEHVRVACIPFLPTEKEIEEHNTTHRPFRSWCKHCIWGRAEEGFQQKDRGDRGNGAPVVDFGLLGKED